MYDVAASIVTYRSDLVKLRQCVKSLNAQKLNAHLEIIDNDSGDTYFAELHRMPNIKISSSGTNNGYGFGHNFAIKKAPPHRYYLVMNPDVVLQEGTLLSMINYMDGHSSIALLVPRVLYPDGRPQTLNKRLPNVFDFFVRRFLPRTIRHMRFFRRRQERYEMHDMGYSSVYKVPFPSGCFMLFRADALQKVGGFDERFFMYLEDCDISRRIAEHGDVVYYPEAVITHYWTRGAHHDWRLTWQFIRSMWIYFNKWGWKWF